MLTNLKHELVIIEVRGPDSRKFLQGQLTNDIHQLDTENKQNFQFSAHLNNKGRILASFIVIKPNADTYYLITPKVICDKIIPRLKMFVLRSKVEFSIPDLYPIFSNAPLLADLQIAFKDKYFISIFEKVPDGVYYDLSPWKKFLVDFGYPLIYTQTYEIFTPQQVNYDLLDGVNFKKGCYTGQEIVARTHYLGKVKRRMYRFSCVQEVVIGQVVFSPKMNNQEVGVIVEMIEQNGGYIGLVSLQNDCSYEAFLDIANTQPLVIQPLEYSK